MTSCKEITELVTDYVERRLSLPQRFRFQVHLGTCRHCRAYLRQMRETIRLTGRLPDPQLPASLEAELLTRFRTFRR
jgi:anti-sigma factor RsiW